MWKYLQQKQNRGEETFVRGRAAEGREAGEGFRAGEGQLPESKEMLFI